MIFEALDKIKRNAIFSAILLMAIGAVLLICPEAYYSIIIIGVGYGLAILATVMMLNFFASKKSLMDYIKFVAALILLIGGICVLVFRNDAMRVLAYTFGVLLMLDGLHTGFNAVTYSRRSHRKAWWVLIILAALLIFIAIMLFCNPWFSTERTLIKAIGVALLFASIVSTFRLILTWPVNKEDRKEEEEVKQDA